MPKVRSSRRIPPLKESDIDHEINLVDNSASIDGSRVSSPGPEHQNGHLRSTVDEPLTTSENGAPVQDGAVTLSTNDHGSSEEGSQVPGSQIAGNESEAGPSTVPLIHEEQSKPQRSSSRKQHPRVPSPETDIDVLYENERGGFLCGIPLFSSAALGNLDPPAWTNAVHKASPTDTRTAQVPDPSWEWAWPEWRVNRDKCAASDKDGWEYSFMFSKRFSWHAPRWYNSFVRRRAWIRRRIRKQDRGAQSEDPHLLHSEYFSVVPSNQQLRPISSSSSRNPSVLSGASSGVNGGLTSKEVSRGSAMLCHAEDNPEAATRKVDLTTIDALMTLLRRSRIDREKLEAVENYLEHSADSEGPLGPLQNHMHEIMSLFVFQASRRLLLTRLIRRHDDESSRSKKQQQSGQVQSLQGDEASEILRKRVENLALAIHHADEEVKRLEYWSDVKGMAENGETEGAVDQAKGWGSEWNGLDKSGAQGANKEKLP
ncbi:hypothetical protein BX600DRAFT_509612 [Xylariales sp. PMI_506]|nr:hypothetical protein BX600DRAFT_509612 [Xylariales sp. PMI_506]